jgi:hypothetical protein
MADPVQPTRNTGTATFTRATRNDGKVVETITAGGTWYPPTGCLAVELYGVGGGGG